MRDNLFTSVSYKSAFVKIQLLATKTTGYFFHFPQRIDVQQSSENMTQIFLDV